jgi:hypothetical protein
MTTIPDIETSIVDLYDLELTGSVDLSFDLECIEMALHRDFQDTPAAIAETRKAIKFYLNSGAELLGYGRTRICFLEDDNRVIKIPFTREGYQASSREVHTYENFKKDPEAGWIPTAECYFTQVAGIDIWLLSMERVIRPQFGDPRPPWVDSVDCGQVGYNSAGELVAFDL